MERAGGSERAYVLKGGRVKERESERGRVRESRQMGAVKSVNRGALLHLLDVLAARPTWLIVIEA